MVVSSTIAIKVVVSFGLCLVIPPSYTLLQNQQLSPWNMVRSRYGDKKVRSHLTLLVLQIILCTCYHPEFFFLDILAQSHPLRVVS